MKSITALKIELIEKALSDLGCTVRPTAPEHMNTRRLNELITIFERAWPLHEGCYYTYDINLPEIYAELTPEESLTLYYSEGSICGRSVRDTLDKFEHDVLKCRTHAARLHPDAISEVSYNFI